MSEFDIIKNTKFPNTLETIKNDLINLGIKEGDIVLVHSSMSKIGWVCGDELTIVQALLDVVGNEGTIVMPAHTSGNSNPDDWSHPPVPDTWKEEIRRTMPGFNSENSPTRGMGKICECFRNYEGTVRSNHPQVSFCANGKYKNEIVEKHDLSYALGMNTPIGKLYELDAKVLLLGVGYSNCTCMHTAETLVTKPNICKKGAAVVLDGKREWVWYEDIDYNSDCFDEIGLLYEKKATDIVFGNIGGATCRVVNLKSLVNYTKEFLEENNNMNIVYTNCGKLDSRKIFLEYKKKLDLYEDIKKIKYKEVLKSNEHKIHKNIENYTKILCNGKCIGYYSMLEEDNKVELTDFYILDEYYNRGFAKKVLKHCMENVEKKDIPVMFMYVYLNDSKAIELYTKCGFTVREIISETRCVMSKKMEKSL